MDKDNATSVLDCIKKIRERWDSLPSDDREDYIKSLVKEKDDGNELS